MLLIPSDDLYITPLSQTENDRKYELNRSEKALKKKKKKTIIAIIWNNNYFNERQSI